MAEYWRTYYCQEVHSKLERGPQCSKLAVHSKRDEFAYRNNSKFWNWSPLRMNIKSINPSFGYLPKSRRFHVFSTCFFVMLRFIKSFFRLLPFCGYFCRIAVVAKFTISQKSWSKYLGKFGHIVFISRFERGMSKEKQLNFVVCQFSTLCNKFV